MEGEKAAFINGLKNFLSDQSKRFDPHPRLAGKVIDLHDLYYKVTLLGGYRKVSEKELWEDILTEYKLPASSASLCYGLRVVYQRYLLEYERIHFLGDVEVAAKSYSDSSRIRHIPYGSDRDSSWLAAAERGGKSGDKSQRSHYEKLTFALLCCLPNEVDFAINACTLLSGESRHVLRLPNCPQILDALLLHAGILSEGLHSYAEIGEEWRAKSRHDFQQFWADTVDDEYVLGQVFRRRDDPDADGASCSSSTRGGHERASRSGYRALLFHSNRALGVQEYEGQRVLQIALVLLNLSFEEFNVTLLARSRSILHFVFLCIHSNYSALRQTGLDILGNLSVHIKLQLLDLGIGVCLYKSLLSCVSSSDKFEILRGFEILGSISHAPANLAHLCVNIEDAMLTTALNLLVLPDIELAVAALEMLYRLTQIGDDLCTRIALIVGSIDILMGLVTLNVRVFGQDKLAKIRLARRIAPVVPDVQKNLNSKAATPGDKSKDPNHHHQQQPRHHAKTPPPPLPTHLRPTAAPRPHLYPAPPSIHVRPLARAVSRPSGAGPMYTHSETRVRPPVFHYMPAPPPTIALDGSAESFAKLWIWSTFELSEDGGVGLNRTMLYADYMQSAQQYDMAHKLLSTSQFFTCLQTVFPRCMSRLLVRAEGEPSTYHVSGLRKRQTPFPVPGHQARHDAGAATRPPVPPPPPPVLIRVDSSSQRCAKIAAGDSQPQRAKCDGENVVTSSCNGAKRAIDEPAAARVDNPAKRQKLTPGDDDVTKSASTESAVAVVNGTHFDGESAASPAARCNCPTDKLSATKCAADESLKSGGRTADKTVMVNGTSSHELVVGRLSSSSSAKPPTSDPKSKTASHDDAPAPVATIHVVTSPSKPSATPPTVNGFWREDDVANSEKSVLSVTTTAVAAATRRETAPLSPTATLKQCHPKQEQTRCNTTTAATAANSINHQQLDGNFPPGISPPSDAAAVPSSSSSSSSPADPNVACLVKTSHCESVIRDDNLDRASAPKAIVLDDDSVRHAVRDKSPVRGGDGRGDHVMERAVAREAKSIVGHVAAKPIMCDVRAGANFAMRAAAASEKTNGYFAGCHFTASQPAAAAPPHQPAMHQHHAPMRPQLHSNHTATATAVVAHQQQPPAVAVDLMAPDASLLILYRNCGKPDFEDFTDRSEDAVSVSIRLTAVLILTNLARYSDVARSMVQRHKPKIATLAMSAMDCSPMLAKLLAALEHER